MKKIIVLIALLVGFSATYAQTFNPVVPSGEVSLTTNVIHPLIITNVQQQTQIPTVIKGQVRDLTPDESYLVFRLTREAFQEIVVHMDFAPYPVNGVKLDGTWMFNPGDWDIEQIGGFAVIPNTSNWYWNPNNETVLTFKLKLDKIDASDPSVTTGTATFVATMTGQYNGL